MATAQVTSIVSGAGAGTPAQGDVLFSTTTPTTLSFLGGANNVTLSPAVTGLLSVTNGTTTFVNTLDIVSSDGSVVISTTGVASATPTINLDIATSPGGEPYPGAGAIRDTTSLQIPIPTSTSALGVQFPYLFPVNNNLACTFYMEMTVQVACSEIPVGDCFGITLGMTSNSGAGSGATLQMAVSPSDYLARFANALIPLAFFPTPDIFSQSPANVPYTPQAPYTGPTVLKNGGIVQINGYILVPPWPDSDQRRYMFAVFTGSPGFSNPPPGTAELPIQTTILNCSVYPLSA